MLDGGTGREGRGGLAAPSQLGTGQSTGGGSAGHYSRPTPRSPRSPRSPRPSCKARKMREIVHLQAGQCGNQIGAKVGCAEEILEWLKNEI